MAPNLPLPIGKAFSQTFPEGLLYQSFNGAFPWAIVVNEATVRINKGKRNKTRLVMNGKIVSNPGKRCEADAGNEKYRIFLPSKGVACGLGNTLFLFFDGIETF